MFYQHLFFIHWAIKPWLLSHYTWISFHKKNNIFFMKWYSCIRDSNQVLEQEKVFLTHGLPNLCIELSLCHRNEHGERSADYSVSIAVRSELPRSVSQSHWTRVCTHFVAAWAITKCTGTSFKNSFPNLSDVGTDYFICIMEITCTRAVSRTWPLAVGFGVEPKYSYKGEIGKPWGAELQF